MLQSTDIQNGHVRTTYKNYSFNGEDSPIHSIEFSEDNVNIYASKAFTEKLERSGSGLYFLVHKAQDNLKKIEIPEFIVEEMFSHIIAQLREDNTPVRTEKYLCNVARERNIPLNVSPPQIAGATRTR